MDSRGGIRNTQHWSAPPTICAAVYCSIPASLPTKRGKGNKAGPAGASGDTTSTERGAFMTCAQRQQRVFDIETCNSYGGVTKINARREDPVVIWKILTHLDNKAAWSTGVSLLSTAWRPAEIALKESVSFVSGRNLNQDCADAQVNDCRIAWGILTQL